MPRTRRAFTDEFKREAVKLVKQPGAKVTHIARDLGIEQSVLRRRVSQEHGGVLDMRSNKPLRSESASEVKRLQRELRRVTTERDILKKRSATFQGTRSEVSLYCSPSRRVAHAGRVPRDERLVQQVLWIVRSCRQ
ncbi:MAG: hypothetical protein EOP13_31235 [Pseudomonas sp.]|uniref:transposase n=1 Tax=Pseudomonas sp. TaxID=306 RepID=UPI00121E33F1|nr:MAG: hypothetical protein EOP13_31235 [Pseudomonas sp.]